MFSFLYCWNIATDEGTVDSWKSEVVEFFFIFFCRRFQGEGQVKKKQFEYQ
jgi:hypothetical protein